jgi:putative acetyltransferase
MDHVKIELTPFQSVDQAAVKRLVQEGLAEHFGFLDSTKNPDLDDIASSYANATFLVARQDGEIIGCGALIPRSAQHAEIVRMSVKKEWRGQHIGKKILNALCDAARPQGFTRIILETTDTWAEVIAFYQRNGFQITHYENGDVYFERHLT